VQRLESLLYGRDLVEHSVHPEVQPRLQAVAFVVVSGRELL
jgi:hypothetical protein